MTKYAVISTDSNPEYYSLIPIVAYSWHKLGYTPVVIVVNCPMPLIHMLTKYCPEGTIFRSLPAFEGVRDGTIAQFARLFAFGEFKDDDEIITGDGDMIVMKDIFTNEGMTSYGFDLTGRTDVPICYVKGTVMEWSRMLFTPKVDLWMAVTCSMPAKAYSDKWEDYWDVDQKFLTANALSWNGITFVDRGFSGPVAANRWDRYNWDVVPDDIIDVHCIRGLHRWPEVTAMAEYLFPGEVDWMGEFYEEIKQLQP